MTLLVELEELVGDHRPHGPLTAEPQRPREWLSSDGGVLVPRRV